MKNRNTVPHRPDTTVQFPPTGKLAAYVSGAIGSATFLAAPQAEAAIIYWNPSDAVEPVNTGYSASYIGFNFDMLTGAVTASGSETNTGFLFYSRHAEHESLRATLSDSFGTVAGPSNYELARLTAGTVIGAASNFAGSYGYKSFGNHGSSNAQWDTEVDGTTGFVGLRFAIAGQSHYGWARFNYDDATTGDLTLLDFAYEDVAGQSISAGDIGIAAAPEPSRALLALAGFGAVALRRRRKMAA